MKLRIAAVGRLRDRPSRALVDDYLGRIRRYAKVEEVELKDSGDAELEKRIQKALPPRGVVVALDVDGERWSSEGFARFVEGQQLASVSAMTFLIGGSYGLPAAVRKAADHKMSLGPMTLPHRLARVVLAEQLYRAFTILRGEPYSH